MGLYRHTQDRKPYQPTGRWSLGDFKPDEVLVRKQEFIPNELLHPKKVVDVSGFEPPTCSV